MPRIFGRSRFTGPGVGARQTALSSIHESVLQKRMRDLTKKKDELNAAKDKVTNSTSYRKRYGY